MLISILSLVGYAGSTDYFVLCAVDFPFELKIFCFLRSNLGIIPSFTRRLAINQSLKKGIKDQNIPCSKENNKQELKNKKAQKEFFY